MKKSLIYFIVLLLGVGLAFAGGKLISLDKKISDHKEVLEIKGEGSLPLPDFYPSTKDPSLLILKFKGIDVAPIKGKHPFREGVIRDVQVKASSEGGEVRIKFSSLKPFSIFSRGNSVIVEVDNTDVQEARATGPSVLKDVSLRSGNGLTISLIFSGRAPDYRAFLLKKDPAHGKSTRLVLDLPNAKARKLKKIVGKEGITAVRAAQFNPKTARVVLDLYRVPSYKIQRLHNRLDIVIASPETKINPPVRAEKVSPGPSAPVLPPKPKTTSVKPAAAPKASPAASKAAQVAPQNTPPKKKGPIYQTVTIAGGHKKYYGEKYTFRFKDADIRDVVTFIAKLAHLNVIFDPGVEGKVTCELVDIPWDQALDLILKTNKLGYIIDGNVLRVAPMEVIAKEAEQRRKMQESAMPLTTVMRTLSYANAKSVERILKKYLSSRGEIVVDERTNTLIIKDIPDRIKEIDRIISTLDAPIPQVSIQARIVETVATYARNLGIQWGFMGYADPYHGNQTSLVFPNRILLDGTPVEGAGTGGLTNPLNGYAVNLPAATFNSALGLSLGNVTDSFALDVGLTAMEEEGWGKILSAPKVSTQDNHEAVIRQGRQIPVQTNINNTIMVRYVNAVLELKVTPHITADQTIIMKVDIKNDSADFSRVVMGIPTIITQSSTTVMMVKDGSTAVIGGMYRIEDNTNYKKTPFLNSIPLIGDLLFKSSSINRTNRELLIFITPKIIRK